MGKRPASDPTAEGPSKVSRIDGEPQPSTSVVDLITFICHICSVTLGRGQDLARHLKTQHGGVAFTCDVCGKKFARKDNLDRHLKTHSIRVCDECGIKFLTEDSYTVHMKTHKNVSLTKPGDLAPSTDPRNPPSSACPPSGCKTALNGSYERHRVQGTEDDVDLPAFLRAQPHSDLIRDAIGRKKSIKFFVSTNIIMVRPKNWITRGEQESRPYFTSRCSRVLEDNNIGQLLEMAYAKIVDAMSQYLREGSGWVVGHINFVDLIISTYKPMRGSSYIPLPVNVALSRGVINVKNEDQKCFLWAVLSALHPEAHDPDCVSNYTPHENSLNMGDLSFPILPEDIPRFEKSNNLHINLFEFRDEEVFPIYISEPKSSINLLLISNDAHQHYCWIKDFNKLMCSTMDYVQWDYYCVYCLQRFSKQWLLDQHVVSCQQHVPHQNLFPGESVKITWI